MLKLPPPVWMLIDLIAAGAVSAGFKTGVHFRSVPIGVTLIILGVGLALSAATLFRRLGTEVNPTSESNARLVTWGPFRLTRNPMYTGLVLVSLGIAFWAGALPMFAVPLLVFATTNWVHIPFEEAKMRRQFGDAFDAYTRRTRRWI
jgi:protein-S-isoprenylcysteine O-methyltransferase Ste14